MTELKKPDEVGLRPHYKAHYHFQFLSAAFRFGLFDILEKEPGTTLTGISERLGLEQQPTRILLLGCTATGLVRKEGDGYHNTPLTQPLGERPGHVPATYIPWETHGIYRAISWFYESLQENSNIGLQREIPGTAPTLYGRLAENPELESTFHTMMSAVTQLVAEDVATELDLSEYRHLLDVGGGAAMNAVHVAQAWPDLEITIGDLPSIVPQANDRIAAQGLGHRVRAVSLDAFHDEFPVGHDAVFFAHFLEIWSSDRIRALLAKASRALPSGGGVFVVTPYQYDDETGPERSAYLSAYFHTIASGEGMVYTPKEYEQWFDEAGIEPAKPVQLGPDTVVICGRKR
ncbi:methyltransferase [Streptomyces lydicus]|uniref:Methyltransferase n=1 Tax=Streptomyces lydicus TaxID=47763 RepID=A0A3Q9K2J5_9ACTN|nr:methyltransferase [Streptomyces lydicus]AZS70038.1 methyltransferase [Streptomyces lydicus]